MHQRDNAKAMAARLTMSALCVLGASNALGADYTVQIGAFGAAPEKGFARDASEFGEVLVNEAGDGITRVSVGRYPTQSQAKDALTRLQIAGYNDAYITRVKSGLSASSSQLATPAQVTKAVPASPSAAPSTNVSATASAARNTPAPAASSASSSSQAGRFRLRTHDTQSGKTTDLQVSPAGGNQPPAVVAGVGADKVPAHLRNKLVYLDGVPHIKDGDEFIPMKDAVNLKP